MWYTLGLYSTHGVLWYHSTGQDSGIASLCVVHIGIVLHSPVVYYVYYGTEYRTGQWDIASLCVVHIGIVLHSPVMYYGTQSTGQDSGI